MVRWVMHHCWRKPTRASAPLFANDGALFFGEVDGVLGVFPFGGEGEAAVGGGEGEGEFFGFFVEGFFFHVDAGEFVFLDVGGVGDAPLADLFVDNEFGGAIGFGLHAEGVSAGGDGGVAEGEIDLGDEGGGIVGTHAPDGAVGDDVARAPNFTFFAGFGVFGERGGRR